MLSLATAAILSLRPPPRPNPNSIPHLRTSRSPRVILLPPLNLSTPRPRPLLWPSSPRGLGLLARAGENGTGDASEGPAVEADEVRGQSTMPERFRYLTKEVPERPVRWPWLIALVFLIYAWRTVLWELTNWKKAAAAILHFIGYISKLAIAFLLYYIGDPITGLIRCIEFSLYNIRYFYSSIVAFAPVPELTRIIFFSSTVIAIAEATVDNPVNSQPYLLTLAGIVAFGAVKGFVPEPLFCCWGALGESPCYWFVLGPCYCSVCRDIGRECWDRGFCKWWENSDAASASCFGYWN